jgi:hypothetical protein
MEKEFTQKDLDSTLNKAAEEMNAEFTKSLELKDSELTEVSKKLEASEKEVQEAK